MCIDILPDFTFSCIRTNETMCKYWHKKNQKRKPTDPAILLPERLWDKLDRKMCLNDPRSRGEVGGIMNSCIKMKK